MMKKRVEKMAKKIMSRHLLPSTSHCHKHHCYLPLPTAAGCYLLSGNFLVYLEESELPFVAIPIHQKAYVSCDLSFWTVWFSWFDPLADKGNPLKYWYLYVIWDQRQFLTSDRTKKMLGTLETLFQWTREGKFFLLPLKSLTLNVEC